MFTLAGFSQSQDTAGVLTNVAAIVDGHINASGNNITVPDLNRLIAAYALGATITQAQLQSPRLRRTFNYDLRPLEVTALPQSLPRMVDLRENPIELTKDEFLNALVAEAAVGAERESVFVWMADNNLAKPAGEIFTIRATGTTTLTAFAWSLVTLTLSQQLAAGRYALVGARVETTNIIAYRFQGVQYPWRPGGIGVASAGLDEWDMFRFGNLGTWLEFQHNVLPSLECFASVADTAQTVHLDLVQIG